MLLSLAPAAAERAQLRALADGLAAPHAAEVRQALGDSGDGDGGSEAPRLPLSSATLLALHAAGARCSPPLRLAHLLRGATLVHAPMPVREKSPELQRSLAAIALALERQQYAAMLTPGAPPPPLGAAAAVAKPLTRAEEAAAWAEVSQLLSALASVALSAAAVAAAAWWAAGYASTLYKTTLALFAALVVAVAEAWLYTASWTRAAQARQRDEAAHGLHASVGKVRRSGRAEALSGQKAS